MFQTFVKAWKTPELRKKILFVLFILVLYRIGAVLPVPYVNAENFSTVFSGTILTYLSTLSGGALANATLFALGISPYITASIVMQLLCVAFPRLGELSKQGEDGKQKINTYTRWITVVLSLVTAIGYYMLLANNQMLVSIARKDFPGSPWFLYAVVIIFCFCAGSAIVMWLAERITENGLGNGISVILFFNIIQSLPSTLINMVRVAIVGFRQGMGLGFVGLGLVLLVLLTLLAMVFFIVFITGSERRIPIQYAKRVVGRKMYGGQNTNLPLQLNMSGVMPVIFASSIVTLPATIMTLCRVDAETKNFWGGLYRFLGADGWFYPIILFILIIAFAYFYITISFNPVEVSNNLKRNGGMIPGIRQGRPTAEYIAKILSKITLMGALFLSIIAILPTIANPLILKPLLNTVISNAKPEVLTSVFGYSSAANIVASIASTFTFGGTSILIVVGIALETAREIEGQLTMRNYKGFLS